MTGAIAISPIPFSADADGRWLSLVRPRNWRTPEPAALYTLVVIGGGTAGLVTAAAAVSLGARVALVEKRYLGGDCLNAGCVPSKALLRSARAVGDARRASSVGVGAAPAKADFGAVMRRMRETRAELAAADSAWRLRDLGIDVFFGSAKFLNQRTIGVGDLALRFHRAVIASGSRSGVPPVPGLANVRYTTNDTLFQLVERPSRLLIVGGGPIGCEMAQAFARFGSCVTIVDLAPRLLPREDPEASGIVKRALEADGVRVEVGVKLIRAGQNGRELHLWVAREGRSDMEELVADELLIAAGRTPNLEDLDLRAAGIEAAPEGVVVDERLRTSNARVFAVGDVCSAYKFTHAADAMARLAVQNALFHFRRKVGSLVIPWCTYTDPEVGHVGLTAEEAAAHNLHPETITIPFADVDRAVLDGDHEGFVRVHHDRGRILGCTVVSSQARHLIGHVAYVMSHGGTLADLSVAIYPYPSEAEALRKAGDAYRRGLLTPLLRTWLTRYFRWTTQWN